MAYTELEQRAIEFATKAVEHDNQGEREKALEHYKKAVELLRTLIEINPAYDLNRFYTQRAYVYQRRIEVLKRVELNESESIEFTDVSGKPQLNRTDDLSLILEQTSEEKPNVKWSDVIGLNDVKRAIREAIIYPIQRPDLFPLGWPRGILLFGPPGCGKTLIAAAVATEINAAFISVDPSSIMSKWLGDAEKNVARIFKWARAQSEKNRPVIILIDEVDSLIGKRQNEVGGEVRVRNQLLKETDGIIDKNKKIYIYVIGATNKPWDLDGPFIRRFQKRFYVPLPDEDTRFEMFKFYTKDIVLDPRVSLKELAMRTKGYSGSDIRDICQDVYMKKVSHLFETGQAGDVQKKPKPVEMADFKNGLVARKPSVLPQMAAAYEAWISLLQAA
ncbi:hypothetical protein AC482_00495 [miscellaneous Crenarchaeota group-15 archaeon DG-45]|uniref:AAA family ATPase n=1 Tax=miscellaneous Crenarchaeota group-15 archaeon DG-45 TaxID=1685127 RepID=A0A0M0BSE9_9ARCH|nr:MAG: hypothetical protein AC482_00495 [miscellaneous Crenarchaeota group-15 archaeon DG-45]